MNLSELALANFDAEPYWEAAAKGELVVARCTSCGEAHYYPKAICPFCREETVEFELASGEGKIYSLAITEIKDKPRRVLAYVTLAEGPTMMTKIVDAPDDISIGDPVRVDFEDHPEGLTVPVFRLDRN